MNAGPPVFDVCVVGSANLDLVAMTARIPAPGETVLGHGYAEYPGGKGLNQAVAAARAGARVAFVGAVGSDTAGHVLLTVLRADGIDVANVAVVDGPTGRALIGVADSGENSIIVVAGANASVTASGVPAARVVLAQLETPVRVVHDALAAARAAGAITVLNPAPAQPLPPELLALCDIVIPNEHEAELLGGPQAMFELGATVVVVTRGAAGAELHSAAGVVAFPALRVDTIDTTAAGDAFCGALCARLAMGDHLDEAMRFAGAAGALATTVAGAVPSLASAEAIERLLSAAT